MLCPGITVLVATATDTMRKIALPRLGKQKEKANKEPADKKQNHLLARVETSALIARGLGTPRKGGGTCIQNSSGKAKVNPAELLD